MPRGNATRFMALSLQRGALIFASGRTGPREARNVETATHLAPSELTYHRYHRGCRACTGRGPGKLRLREKRPGADGTLACLGAGVGSRGGQRSCREGATLDGQGGLARLENGAGIVPDLLFLPPREALSHPVSGLSLNKRSSLPTPGTVRAGVENCRGTIGRLARSCAQASIRA